MKKRNLIIFITIGAIILTGGLAACKRGYHHGFDEFDLAAMTERIASRLDLTEAQQAELDRMAGEIADKVKTIHTAKDQRRQELANVIRQDAIDSELVDARIDEKLETMREMADFIAERAIAFHGILSPEQREKIAVHIENRAAGDCKFGWR